MTTTPLSFAEIQRQAGCGWRINELAQMLAVEKPMDALGPMMDEQDVKQLRRLGRIVQGVEIVLEAIGQTPNAYINREALDAMAEYVQEAREILEEEWVADYEKQKDRILGYDQHPDYIPM